MDYSSLGALQTDATFAMRVGYAILKYASYISNEDPGTTNHVARHNWALRATSSVVSMRDLLMPAILMDGNVVAGGSAVTDANLQSATETAANTLIGTPTSYADLMAMATDLAFQKRVQIALAHFASYVLGEAPNTANHAARYNWARNAILNLPVLAASLAVPVVLDANVSAALQGVADSTLQAAVEYQVGLLLL
jgi:hypothetical protein